MPNHSDRVAKQYDDLCVKCLKHSNRDWDDECSKPSWCEGCYWRWLIKTKTISMPNENIQRILDRYPE